MKRPRLFIGAVGLLAIALTVPTTAAAGPTPPSGAATSARVIPANAERAAPATSEPKQVRAPVPNIRWERCVGPRVLCARVPVPLDYDHPSGATIKLAMVKYLATEPRTRIGSLFTNPGGPGGSSVHAAGFLRSMLGKRVRSRFDIIGIDPRGTNSSTPAICRSRPGDEPLPRFPYRPFPLTAGQQDTWLRSDQVERSFCNRRGNAVLDHMTTADTARDMDLIRQAVGDRRLSYYGISYGTMLGATYAAMFPDRVRAIVTDGVLDPIAWTSGRGDTAATTPVSGRLGSGEGAFEALTSAFVECERVGVTRCPAARSVADRWTELTRELRRGPVTLDDGYRLTYQDVVGAVLGSLYDPRAYRQIMQFINQLHAVVAADRRTARTRAASTASDAWRELKETIVRDGSPTWSPASARRADVRYPWFTGVMCSDSVNPTSPNVMTAAHRRAAVDAPWFGQAWLWVSSVCVNWPGSDDDAFRGPWRTETSTPLLVVGNAHDPATAFSGARALNELMPDSRLLELDGWGHGAIGSGPCIRTRMESYLIDRVLPAPGTVCRPARALFPQRR